MKRQQKTLAMWILIILSMAFLMRALEPQKRNVSKITYSDFITEVETGNVAEVTFQGESTIQGKFVDGYKEGNTFELILKYIQSMA